MTQKSRNSMAEDDESLEAPAPHLIAHRKKFEAFERDLTGGHHIGHLPVYVVELEGWTFRRCRCGFSLALTPSGAIWWLRTTKVAMAINSFKALLRALNSNCWAHPRAELLTSAVISPPAAIAEITAETPERPAAANAISNAAPPASLEMQNKLGAKSNTITVPPVEKPPPVKRRRTYLPADTTRTTRSRPNRAGR
jgi:hypothetical protein